MGLGTGTGNFSSSGTLVAVGLLTGVPLCPHSLPTGEANGARGRASCGLLALGVRVGQSLAPPFGGCGFGPFWLFLVGLFCLPCVLGFVLSAWVLLCRLC